MHIDLPHHSVCPVCWTLYVPTISCLDCTGLLHFSQRNRYPETGCNGTPSLSNMTDFYVNATETFCDGARVCTMVIDERHSTVPSTQLLTSWSRDKSPPFKMSGKRRYCHHCGEYECRSTCPECFIISRCNTHIGLLGGVDLHQTFQLTRILRVSPAIESIHPLTRTAVQSPAFLVNLEPFVHSSHVSAYP